MLFAREQEYIENMSRLGVSGYIIQATYRFGILGMELEKKNKNLVYLDVSPYDSRGKCVKSGNYSSVYEAITQCVQKGYQQFIMISDGSQDDYGGVGNAQGFKTRSEPPAFPSNLLYQPGRHGRRYQRLPETPDRSFPENSDLRI